MYGMSFRSSQLGQVNPVRFLCAFVFLGAAAFGLLGTMSSAHALDLTKVEPPPSSSPPTTGGTVPPATTVPEVETTIPATSPPTSTVETAPPTTSAPQSTWRPQQSGNTYSSNTVAPRERSNDAGVNSVPPMTTTQDLLVGPSTTPAPTTTVAKRSSSTVTTSQGKSDPKVWAVVVGLLVVALALGAATVFYARATKPVADTPQRGRSRYSDLVITPPESP